MRRAVKIIGALVVLVGLGLAAFIADVIYTHSDKPDYFGPSPESKLAEWTEACELGMSAGTSLEDVRAFLRARSVISRDEFWRSGTPRRYFWEDGKDDWIRVHIIDKDVRNRGVQGEIDLETVVDLTDEVVTSCRASVFRSGR